MFFNAQRPIIHNNKEVNANSPNKFNTRSLNADYMHRIVYILMKLFLLYKTNVLEI